MTSGLSPGWYILLYHDVSWEETPFVRHIGGTCPPDVLRDHLFLCQRLGELASVQDAAERFMRGKITSPLFSFWFDDGFVGVRKYALPILADHGVTGATSICSRFINRAEMFWRFKLSYLHSIDGGTHLRARLRPLGYSGAVQVRNFTMDLFGPEILSIIDTLYDEAVPAAMRDDAFRLFETPDGVRELYHKGWVVANHSAAHYPVSEKHVQHMLINQFEECASWIQHVIGRDSDYWVLPFDRNTDPAAIATIRNRHSEKTIVRVGNVVNLPPGGKRPLYRITAPANDRELLQACLFSASTRANS
jgi:peptidoglycan/xylan/chitin deacetylase (PgdA/CDA1 family)